jgi:hypothetical protein
MFPTTSMVLPFQRASTGTSTGRVTPCRVRSPVAVTDTASPAVGGDGSSSGPVSVKVASGKASVSRPRVRMALSRRSSSLSSAWRPAVTSAAVTVVSPSTVRVPDTSLVRPTASDATDRPAKVSRTR